MAHFFLNKSYSLSKVNWEVHKYHFKVVGYNQHYFDFLHHKLFIKKPIFSKSISQLGKRK